MKFLLIINNDIDGVGQPAINLCSNLKKKGHESKIIALHKFTKNKNIIKVNRSLILRFFLYIFNFLKKDFSELFGFGYSTIKYTDIKKYIGNADIIIIYTLYKILSNEMLYKILNTKKIVYFRPLDINYLRGNPKKAYKNLKFKPKYNFYKLIKTMIDHDLDEAKKEKILIENQ